MKPRPPTHKATYLVTCTTTESRERQTQRLGSFCFGSSRGNLGRELWTSLG